MIVATLYPPAIDDAVFEEEWRIFLESESEPTSDDVVDIEYDPVTGMTIEELAREIVYQENLQYSHMWENDEPELDDKIIEEMAKDIREIISKTMKVNDGQ